MRYEDEVFTDEQMSLDGKGFVRCRFENCKLTYAGGPVDLEDVKFVDCEIEMQGAARNTQTLMLGLQANAVRSMSGDQTLEIGGVRFVRE